MKVLVTGASGFLGKRTAQALTDRGSIVVPLLLPGERTDLPGPLYADLTENIELDLEGTDAVVHCAGLLESGGHSGDRMMAVNHRGTVKLFEHARSQNVRRFVFISSISAAGPQGRRGRPITETMPPRPEDDYGRSKLFAEKYLEKAAAGSGMDVTVLRPTVIYGPGMGDRTSAMGTFRAVLSRKMPLVGKGSTCLNMLYVDNLVQAILLALERCKGYSIYNIGEGPYTQKEVLDAVVRASEGKGGYLRFPKPVLFALALTFGAARPFLNGPPPLTWTRYKALTTDCWLTDLSRARKELGYAPSISLDEGVQRTFEHYGWSK